MCELFLRNTKTTEDKMISSVLRYHKLEESSYDIYKIKKRNKKYCKNNIL